MPREYVAFGSEETEDRKTVTTFRLDLSWDRWGNVVLTHRTFVNSSDQDNELTHTVGTTLNRKEINDLIRNLRKARDQAFGKDE